MAVFVLVPGMWHGGWCWKKLTPLLRAAGHEGIPITLTGLGERAHLHYPGIDMHTHIQDVVNVLEAEDLQGVILVGHSLGGIIAPAVAARIPQRIRQIVNLDGILPVDGQSVKELFPEYWEDFRERARESGDEWWAPPPDWSFGVNEADLEWVRPKLTAHPLKTWVTPLSIEAASSIPRTYIHCTEGATAEEIAEQEAECRQMGWQYRTLPTGHDAMITDPVGLVELLLEIGDR